MTSIFTLYLFGESEFLKQIYSYFKYLKLKLVLREHLQTKVHLKTNLDRVPHVYKFN